MAALESSALFGKTIQRFPLIMETVAACLGLKITLKISLLLQHYCSYSCWPPAICGTHLELLPHNYTEELNERIKQKTLWYRKGDGGGGKSVKTDNGQNFV